MFGLGKRQLSFKVEVALRADEILLWLKSVAQYGPAAVKAYAHKRLASLTNVAKAVQGDGCAQRTDSTTNIQKVIAINIPARQR